MISDRQYIYGIKAGDCIKIGITTDVSKRLQAVNTCNHCDAEIVFYGKHENCHSACIESIIHEKLKLMGRHKKLEWFNFKDDEHLVLNELFERYGFDYELTIVNSYSHQQMLKRALSRVSDSWYRAAREVAHD